MKRLALFPLVVLLTATCADEERRPQGPVGPSMSLTAGDSAAASGSSVCRAYAAELAVANTQLLLNPTDAVAQRNADALGVAIADACN